MSYFQTEDQTENKLEKSKNDDPVVDLFPDDENEERNSKLYEIVKFLSIIYNTFITVQLKTDSEKFLAVFML